jgi:hypothetical protein
MFRGGTRSASRNSWILGRLCLLVPTRQADQRGGGRGWPAVTEQRLRDHWRLRSGSRQKRPGIPPLLAHQYSVFRGPGTWPQDVSKVLFPSLQPWVLRTIATSPPRPPPPPPNCGGRCHPDRTPNGPISGGYQLVWLNLRAPSILLIEPSTRGGLRSTY